MAVNKEDVAEVPVADGMITWVKPNGVEIKTNSEKATVEKAEELGWKRKK